MKLWTIEATDLTDCWFQCLWWVIKEGWTYKITHGSYAGQKRLELDYVTMRVKFPGVRPLLPTVPAHFGFPDPVAPDYLDDYLPYLMTAQKKPQEEYTYGERLAGFRGVNQIQEVIEMYRSKGYGTNQASMAVAIPGDIRSSDPPCLRMIDTRISNGKLHFVVYFRSWDAWGGLPANLGGLQLLKEYMADAIGIADGEIIAASKGLHLYDHVWDFAKLRIGEKEA